MNNENSDFGAFLAGFIIGGLVGAAAAIILAPQSGEETRSMLMNQGSELRHAGSERLHDYRETASHAVSDARQRAAQAASQVQEQARIVLDEGKARLSGAGDADGEAGSEGAA
jgi:gas vesicle protein